MPLAPLARLPTSFRLLVDCAVVSWCVFSIRFWNWFATGASLGDATLLLLVCLTPAICAAYLAVASMWAVRGHGPPSPVTLLLELRCCAFLLWCWEGSHMVF